MRVRTRFFACATVAYALVLGAQVGGIQQLVKLVEDRTDSSTAAVATTALAGMSVIARLAGGRIVSRVPIVGFTAILAATQAVALALLAFASTTVTIFPAIILFGATVGNILMLQPLLIAQRFGVLDYPRIFSRGQFFSMVGTAGGPLLLGWLYDNAGGYETSYLVAAACSLSGSARARVGRSGYRARPVTAATGSSDWHPNVQSSGRRGGRPGARRSSRCGSRTGPRRQPMRRRRSASTSARSSRA